MHMMINALVLAFTMPGQMSDLTGESPKCRAELVGKSLTTQVEFADGYVVKGPWTVLSAFPTPPENGRDGEAEGWALDAMLNRIVEMDPITGQQRTIEFRQAVTITFRGSSDADLVRQAAQIWCSTVMRSRPGTATHYAPRTIRPLPIAIVPAPAQIAGSGYG
jgi:hypothetical protein